jgi:hypothetical protein
MQTPATLNPPSPYAIRDELTAMVVKDLLGPAEGPEEELDQREDHAYGRYLVGLLAPQSAVVEGEMMDRLGTDGADDQEVGTTDASTSAKDSFFPSTIGMSFMVEATEEAIVIESQWGRYRRVKSEKQVKKLNGEPALVWKREPHEGEPLVVELKPGLFGPYEPDPTNDPSVVVQGKVRKNGQGWLVTVFLRNVSPKQDHKKDEAWVFQPKVRARSAGSPSRPVFLQRHDEQRDFSRMDAMTREESETLEMLYRFRPEFVVGHGVSVHTTLPQPDAVRATAVETEFIPQAEVEQQTPPDVDDNPDIGGVILDMKELAEMPKADLLASLDQLHTAYEQWITREVLKPADPTQRLQHHQDAAALAIANCQRACERLREGIDLIASDPLAEESFRFANRAMWQQRVRSTYSRLVRKKELQPGAPVDPLDIPRNRSWRVFQLAFVILNLPGLTRLDHEDRTHETDAVADLLWFATGGGKTEAYLGLTAYTLALRRLQGEIEGRCGDHGIAVLMRYTLRLLTLQQFQRATALICACETIRRSNLEKWGTIPFRLGLWVGSKATPNSLASAAEALRQSSTGGKPTVRGTPHQLISCPWCGRVIREHHIKVYEGTSEIGRCVTYCSDATGGCEFSEAKSPKEGLPVMVVDEEIYRRPPSLLIATVDKFAQMPWKGEVQHLFGQVSGLCERHGFLSPEVEKEDSGTHIKYKGQPGVKRQDHAPLRPPDLIIQDELHLISGPLGSMVALYETAVDELCTWTVDGKRVRPKVVSSTATIRRAGDQIKKTFLRKVEIFPPQGTSIDDSFFSLRRHAGEQYPGRRYLGICAFGRRYPVAMIRVYTALLGAAQVLYEKYDNLADPWMTLAGYFNSIRELAGTRRLVEDDIRSRVRDADQRGLAKRRIWMGAVEELTSRKSGTDIPGILERLETTFNKAHEIKREADRKAGIQPSPRPYDVLLATNMISVGVDIERLGLMVVAGQPKTTSEYIQASSRVGRSRSGPGLVITLFNWARPRDLSHHETFEHYHDTFYKHVEALSVTPFSAPALKRGLAGILVAMMRLKDQSLNANEDAGKLTDTDPDMPLIMQRIIDRAEKAIGDPSVGVLVRKMLDERRDKWLSLVHNQHDYALGYRDGPDGVIGLLKETGAAEWEEFTCLNSLRDVEGTVNLILDPNPRGLRQFTSNSQSDPS